MQLSPCDIQGYSLQRLLLISAEKHFEMKIINSVVGVFLLFPDFAHDAQNRRQIRWYLVLCMFCLSPGFENQSWRVLIKLSTKSATYFGYLLTQSFFLKAKNKDFFDKILGFFSTKYRITQLFFSKIIRFAKSLLQIVFSGIFCLKNGKKLSFQRRQTTWLFIDLLKTFNKLSVIEFSWLFQDQFFLLYELLQGEKTQIYFKNICVGT